MLEKLLKKYGLKTKHLFIEIVVACVGFFIIIEGLQHKNLWVAGIALVVLMTI